MTCFLCLHNLAAFPIGNEDDDGKEKSLNCAKVSLTAINNYLKLSDNSSNNLSLGDGSKRMEVLLCTECETVASRLTLLCNQLEEIKLKISYSLEQFYGRLKEAAAEEEDNRLEEKLVLLRNKYRKTCKTQLNQLRRPVVKIEKLKTVKVKMKKELVLSDEETGSGNKDFEFESDGSFSEHEEHQFQQKISEIKNSSMEQVEENESVDSSTSLSSLPLSSSHHHPPTKKRRLRGIDAKGNFICLTCGLSFPSKWERRQHTHIHRNARKLKEAHFICTNCDNHQMFKEAKGLERHNMLFHLELLFSDSRMEGITPDQFGEYCKHVLHVEGLISKVPNSLGYECQHCRHLQHNQKKNLYFTTYLCLKKHLFRVHKNILEQKIEELQKTTGVEELKRVILPPVRDNRKCEDCGATFSQSDSLSRHLRENCPFRKNKSVSATRPCKCQDCGAGYKGTAAFYRHRKEKHSNSTKDPIFI